MPVTNQSQLLEHAAQALAAAEGHQFEDLRLLDHYLGRVKPANQEIVSIVKRADEAIRPAIDRIDDLESENSLLAMRLSAERGWRVALEQHLTTMPARLPVYLDHTWNTDEVREWLAREIATAPSKAPLTTHAEGE